MKNLFLLNPSVTFLNHGSFGACPKEIFEDYQHWQFRMERDPVQFISKIGPDALFESKRRLAKFINAEPNDFVFVPNPTHAINILRQNLRLEKDDEILTTNLEYGAMDKTWSLYCKDNGTRYIRQNITLPLTSKEKFLEDFWNGFSKKTKVVFISEITSSTALKLPVKEIVEESKRRGLITIVDGAHSVGHIPVDIKELEPDYYTGACHKWMLTPKGCSFLWVNQKNQKLLSPLIVSWGFDLDYNHENQLHDFHQFNGTRDFSAYLTLPKSIDFLEENNFWKRNKDSHELLIRNAENVCKVLNSKCLAPLTEEFIGLILSFPIQTKNPTQ